MRKTVKAERTKSTSGIKSAENEVNKLQRDLNNLNSNISANKRKIKSCRQDMKICWWQPFKTKCKHIPNYPARGVCEAGNTPWRTAIAANEVAKVGVIAAKVTAQKTLQAIRAGITAIPIDADPRIVGLFTAMHTAKVALEAAKQTVKGVGSFTDILAKGVGAVGKVDVFALKKGSIRGSLSQGLKGKPVVLDMDFRLLGKDYKNRFAFSLTDWKFNAKQFEVIALAAAVKTVIKVGKAAKVVPHVLLNEVEKLYLKRQAEVNEAVAKALEGGGVGSDEGQAALAMGHEITVDQKVRDIQNKAAQRKLLAAYQNVHGIKAGVMQRTIDNLIKANKWVRVGGAANDIGSGPNGKTWVIGTNKEGGGYGIYRWDGKWAKIGGSAVRIDVGPGGHGFVVNNKGNIYRHDGKKWHQTPGGAKDIGVGANGKVWVIGTNKEGGGYGIYRWDNKWTKIGGSAVRIDVDPEGNAWVVNNKGNIYRYDGKKWIQAPGRAKDIGISANGAVMVIGTDDRPYIWNGKDWKKVAGKARQITVDRNGNPWVVNAGQAIYAWDKAAKLKASKPAVTPIRQLLSGNVVQFQMEHSKRCLDNSGSKSKGAQAWQYDCNRKNDNQKWRIVYKDGTWFNLVNIRTGMCLDIDGNSKSKGRKVHQWPCHKGANQQWRLDNQGGGWFRLVVRHSNQCMDVSGGKKGNREKYIQWPCHKGGNQKFKIY